MPMNKNEKSSNKILWLSIKTQLEVMIINGIYKTADKFPSISEVSETFNVGKSTAKKILEQMFLEETITKTRGVGYFVKPYVKEKLKEKHLQEIESGIYSYVSTAKQLGLKEKETKDRINKMVDNIYNTHRE